MDRVALTESSCLKVLICICEKLCHAGACVWFKFVTCHFLFCLFGLKRLTASCLYALIETRKPGGLQGKSHKMGYSPHLRSRCSKVRLLFCFFPSVTAPSTEIQVLWFRHQMYNLHLKQFWFCFHAQKAENGRSLSNHSCVTGVFSLWAVCRKSELWFVISTLDQPSICFLGVLRITLLQRQTY